jgi:hypothetical protein
MPDEETVVWPDDPAEDDGRAEDLEAASPSPTPSDWPATFEEALKQSRAEQEPVAHAAQEPDEPPTEHSMPAVTAKTAPPETAKTVPPEAAKTVPPEAAKTVPPEPASTEPPEPADAETADTRPPAAAVVEPDEAPTSTFKTPLPGMPAASNGEEPGPVEPDAEPAGQPDIQSTMIVAPGEVALIAPELETEAALEVAEEPAPEHEPEPEPPIEAESQAEDAEPEPETAPEPEPEPEPQTEPAAAVEPAPAPKEDEWIPMPVNPPVPNWAPAFGAPQQQAPAAKVEAPAPSVPSWAPAGGRATSNPPATTPGAPAAQGSKPPAQAAAQPAGSRPPDPVKGKTSSWEVVQQKGAEQKQGYAGPTPEDRSYAEWFAWAKRSGAPATACHAAAQGAFRALAAGHDMNTAVQWATLAMAQPPGLVSASRQLYCAWYSLANIDLRLPTPQAHAFATGAISALEDGADAPTAHQAGLAAAGITG